jgi:hypothetical protein
MLCVGNTSVSGRMSPFAEVAAFVLVMVSFVAVEVVEVEVIRRVEVERVRFVIGFVEVEGEAEVVVVLVKEVGLP